MSQRALVFFKIGESLKIAILNCCSPSKRVKLYIFFSFVQLNALNSIDDVLANGNDIVGFFKLAENKTVEDYLETTHLKLFQNFTGSISKTFFMHTSRQNLPSWFDNYAFRSYHSGEVVEA